MADLTAAAEAWGADISESSHGVWMLEHKYALLSHTAGTLHLQMAAL